MSTHGTQAVKGTLAVHANLRVPLAIHFYLHSTSCRTITSAPTTEQAQTQRRFPHYRFLLPFPYSTHLRHLELCLRQWRTSIWVSVSGLRCWRRASSSPTNTFLALEYLRCYSLQSTSLHFPRQYTTLHQTNSLAAEDQNGGEDNKAIMEQKIINEEYKIWKKNVPFLYDVLYA
jgi:hypothetical protein